jgi:hypothetical protein
VARARGVSLALVLADGAHVLDQRLVELVRSVGAGDEVDPGFAIGPGGRPGMT